MQMSLQQSAPGRPSYALGPLKRSRSNLQHPPLLRVSVASPESAAILIWLGDRYPEAGLAPAIDAPERAEYLRWMLFLSASIYSTFSISDGPERFHPDPATHPTLLDGANQRRADMWVLMNDAFDGAPGPFLLGETMSLLDVYVAMMSRWDPGRADFVDQCPALLPAVEATEADPVVAAVWARNFRTGG